MPLPYQSRLAVSYSAEIPDALLEAMESHGRRLGLSMETLERVGNDPVLCEDFVAHAEVGAGDLFIADLTAEPIPAPRARSERPAMALAVFDDGAFVEGF